MAKLKLLFYKAIYELGWWLHKRWLSLPEWSMKYIRDPDRIRYWAQWRGHKLPGWKP